MSSPQLPVPISPFEQEAIPWMADVFRFALSLTGEKADAEDIVQETYLRAHRSWHTYEIGSDCRRWLFAICRNVFLRWRRQHREVPMHEAASLDWGFNPAREPSRTDAAAAYVDLGDAIGRALAELPEPFRSAVSIVDVDDQPYEVAAGRLGVPIGTVRSRLFRGRRLLQQRLGAFAMDAGLLPAAPSRGDQAFTEWS